MTELAVDYFTYFQLPTHSGTVWRDRDDRLRQSTDTPTASALQSKLATDLARIALECSEAGWDGYQAQPITTETLSRAEKFLVDLPPWMQVPDIVPESDGELAVEWYGRDGKTLSISVGETGVLHFAGLFGRNREVHGVEPFVDSVPKRLLRLIFEFTSSTADRTI
jgi:hypothetical protein